MPDLPETGALVPEVKYVPLPGDNAMPAQEVGTRRAGQDTVAAQATATGTAPVGDTQYDLTVVGPNRFPRRFAGDTTTAGRSFRVDVSYYEGVRTPTLHNDGHTPVAFTITHNHYLPGHPQTVRVAPHDSRTWTVHPLEASHGWYDLTVTASADEAWSQRFAGHLETGRPSVSG